MKISNLIATTLAIAGLMLGAASTTQAQEGFFVGGAIGKGYLDENISGFTIDTDSTTWRIFGGYGFSDYFAVEVGYWDLGKFDETVNVGGVDVPVSAEADGYTLAGVGTLPLSERFSLKGRLGFYFHDTTTIEAGVVSNDSSESDLFVGLGIGFDLSEVFELNAGVDYLDTDDADPMFATVGFTLRF